MPVLFSDKMTLFVELNFCQNVLWYACRTLETKDASTKCYNFSIISDHPCDPKRVQLEPYKLINEPWLYDMDQLQIWKWKLLCTLARGLGAWFHVPVYCAKRRIRPVLLKENAAVTSASSLDMIIRILPSSGSSWAELYFRFCPPPHWALFSQNLKMWKLA